MSKLLRRTRQIVRGLGLVVGLVVGLVIGLLWLATPPTAVARPAPAGLAKVQDLRRKLRSRHKRVRRKTLRKLQHSFDAKPEVVRALAPLVRRLAKRDPDCQVRTEALQTLVWRRRDLGGKPHGLLLRALADNCPLANARGADWLDTAAPTYRRRVVARLMALARRSSFYHVQCSALIALGKLRVKKATKLMARALAVGAKTGLGGYGTGYTVPGRSMPHCAVQALQDLHGQGSKKWLAALTKKRDAVVQKLKNKSLSKDQRRLLYVEYWRLHALVLSRTIRLRPLPTTKQVRQWRNRMSKRGYVTASPASLCLSSKTCPAGTSCLHMACVTQARALKVYQTYRKSRRRGRRRPKRGWRNYDNSLAVRLGLGMGGAGHLANLLRRRNQPPPGPPKRWLVLRKRARTAWMAGQCNKAIGLARRSYKLHPSNLSASVIGYCACSIKNASLARWAYRRLRSISRKGIVRACRRKGIKLP